MKTTLCALLALLLAGPALADPVDQVRAKQAASGWKAEGKHILNHRMDKPVKKVTSYPDFHVVQLQPDGFIVVPADDTLGPVIAFSESGQLAPDGDNPLWTLLSADMKTRMASTRSNHHRFADFKTAGAGHRQPDMPLEKMEQGQSRFKELERRGKERIDHKLAQDNQPFLASALGMNSTADDPFPGVSSDRAPATITSVATVDGKVRITHNSDESVSIYVSYDNFRTWQLLDSGIVWPTWVSKQPAHELSGFYKVECDGIYDSLAVETFRHPVPAQPLLLNDMLTANPPVAYQSASISDIRVSPLIPSRWSQQAAAGQSCYNYFTPNHYPCGCVATAMAQLMRYWRCPATGIGQISKTIRVDGAYSTATTRGGDGFGGAYDWNNMPLQPGSAAYNSAQWQMIGSLCYDAGVCIFMSYTYNASGAGINSAASAFTSNFKYANSRCMWNNSGASSAVWDVILRSNLAGGYPVLLSISSAQGGHCVVCDGFGYSGGSLYYHINMGWAAYCDAWYSLPTVDDGHYNFNTVDGFAFNIYPSGTGEIIGGRVLNTAGAPVGGATVTATSAGTFTTTSDSQGYYGVLVTGNQTYTVSAAKAGYTTASVGGVHVGASVPDYNGNSTIGNYFGADITLTQFSFTAVAVTNTVWLRWTAPTNSGLPNNTVYIRWRTDRYPTNAADGTQIYSGTAQVFVHTNRDTSGTVTNFYAIWGNNGSPYASITGTTQAGACADSGLMKLYWTSASLSKSAVWLLKADGSKRSSGYVGDFSSGWSLVGTGDIDGDGTADLIWHNSALGKVAFWMMDPDGIRRSSGYIGDITAGWNLVGVGDIDGDGTVDLVWHHPTLGKAAYWFLNPNGTKRSSGYIGDITAGWNLVGVGDIDGDGTLDLAWHHPTLGKAAYWFLNPNGTKRSSGYIGDITAGWNLVGVGDVDHDGTPDLIWHHPSLGKVAYWFVNPNGTKRSSGYSGDISVGWTLAACAPF